MSDSDSTKLIVLAAIDLEPGSTLVMERAIELAATRSDGEVHVITVFEPELPIGVSPGLVPEQLQLLSVDAVSDFCSGILERLARYSSLARIPSVHLHGVFGRVPDEIVWLAAHLNADFIVMATHGRRGIKRLLLGSAAEKVVRLAGCPVVVVRDKSHAAQWRIPEIEPTCPDCAAARVGTGARELWCARHCDRYVSAQIQEHGQRRSEPPRALVRATSA
jgi:nucleotide-binding universal stress UspA family protein